MIRAVLVLALALGACGRAGPPRPPGPPEAITFPSVYPAPDPPSGATRSLPP